MILLFVIQSLKELSRCKRQFHRLPLDDRTLLKVLETKVENLCHAVACGWIDGR